MSTARERERVDLSERQSLCSFFVRFFFASLCFASLCLAHSPEGRHVSLSVSWAVTSRVCRGNVTATTMLRLDFAFAFVSASPSGLGTLGCGCGSECGELVVNLPCLVVENFFSSKLCLVWVFFAYSYAVCVRGSFDSLPLSLSPPSRSLAVSL